MADERLPIKKLVGLVGPALRLVWRSSRSETIVVIVLQTLSGATLPAQVLAGKWALDSVLEASRTRAGLGAALPAVAAALAAIAAGRLLSAAARQRRPLLPELVARTTQEMLARKAVSLDLETLETPAFHDRLTRAQRQASFRPANMVSDITFIVSSGVAGGGLLIVLATIQPLLVLLVLAAFLPLWIASINGGRAFYRYYVRNTSSQRLIGYVQGILTSPHSAKETQAFSLGPYLLEKQSRLFDERLRELREIIRTRLRRDVVASVASSLANAAAILLILWLHFSGRISLAQTAAAVGALLLLVPRLDGLAGQLGMFHENALFVEDFWSFLDLTPRAKPAPVPSVVAPKTFSTVRVEDVTFSYPEAPAPALKDVSIEIGMGETVALVGENGAGKTTLTKLLCRLYDPDSGTIAWDGCDLRGCDPDELRRRIAVIFQDFVRYQLSARENVGFGDVSAIDDLGPIAEAARQAGAHDFLHRLPTEYETTLGRLFDEGQELSSGQWQRVALARAFFRDAPLVIMDEPTAALDARAEYELFETMRELFKDRAVLLISHRFSSVRMADRIYVLRDGEVIESGGHDELVAAGGLYAELFSLQAASYLGERRNGGLEEPLGQRSAPGPPGD
ncbi:MAG: ABC transporter ATP-binding protein/permease [Actinomycetota bacterium]|nr:ABC transporter ATP-binding protein/permease [Actinomycetota bacterium]